MAGRASRWLLACALLFPLAVGQDAPMYTGAGLDVLAGTNGTGFDTRDSGQAEGTATTTGDAVAHAILNSGSTTTDLGTSGNAEGIAYGINDSGQGGANSTGDAADRALSYAGGTMSGFGASGSTSGTGHRISDSGHFAGVATGAGGAATQSFRRSGGTVTDPATQVGAPSAGYGNDNRGPVMIVASAAGESGSHVFPYPGNTNVFPDPGNMIADLGPKGGTNSSGFGVSDNGPVTDVASTPGDAGDPAIPNSGEVTYDLDEIVTKWGSPFDDDIQDINDAGPVAALGCTGVACQDIRRDPVAARVPEPGTLALVALALLVLSAMRPRRAGRLGRGSGKSGRHA